MGKPRPEALDLGHLHQELYFSDSSATFSLMLFSQRVSLPSALKVTTLFQGFLEELMLGAVLGTCGWVSVHGSMYYCVNLQSDGNWHIQFSVWIRMKGLV